MPRFGKPDAKGRSSGRLNGRRAVSQKPPVGEPFIWLTREMLESDAFRTLGINARRVLSFLQIEHMSHAGQENGQLLAPYSHLVRFGVARSEVRKALDELVRKGLITQNIGLRVGVKRDPSIYRLTFYASVDGRATDEWRNWRKSQRRNSVTRDGGSEARQMVIALRLRTDGTESRGSV